MSPYLFAVSLLVIVSVTNARKRVCPGHGWMPEFEDCNSTCSRKNDLSDNYPSGLKCCHHASPELCGFHCIVPKINIPKPGTCPPHSLKARNDSDWYICDGYFCDVDTDCMNTEKCRSNPCGSSVCILPD